MNISGNTKSNRRDDEEIEKLRDTLLKNERKFAEEIEKLGKNGIGSKTILFSVIIIFGSLFYYMKTKDQSIIQLNEKLNKESKLKDQRIDDLNKQFELKDRHLKSVLSETESKENKLKELNEKLALKEKRLKEVVFEVEDKNKKIIELENKLIKIQTEFKEFRTNCETKDKQIDSLLNEKQLKDKEIDKKYNHRHLVSDALKSEGKVLFSPNQTTVDVIIEVIKETLVSEYLHICFEEPKAELDVYKNCFRDLSVVLHNNLYERLGPYWSVTTGTADHCFSINVINESQSQQYFLTMGNIYFEIFKYEDLFFNNSLPIQEDIQQKETPKEKDKVVENVVKKSEK